MATEGKVPRVLTAMRSRSHQGMLSPPEKKLPTDSKKRSILASIDLLPAGAIGIQGGGRAVEGWVPQKEKGGFEKR